MTKRRKAIAMAGDEVPVIPQDPSTGRDVQALVGVAFVYVGPGWAPGVPARNLMAEEVEGIGRERIRRLRSPHTGEPLYIEISDQ